MSTAEKPLEAGANMNSHNRPRMTPLMYAAINFTSVNYDFDAVYALIKAGADLNTKDNEGMSALMRAARNHNKGLHTQFSNKERQVIYFANKIYFRYAAAGLQR